MSSMQQRKAEILAKRAKLSELKQQRELRQQEFSQTRANSGDASEVNPWVGPGWVLMLTGVASIGCISRAQPFGQQSRAR